MIPKQLREFVVELKPATESSQISWSEADSLAYFCDHKNVTLHISSHFDEDRGEGSYHFRIVANGKITPFTVYEYDEDFYKMRDLWDTVVASANRVGDDIAGFFD